MLPIAWITGKNIAGQVIKQMAYGAQISWENEDGRWFEDYFDVDDYVILVDVDEIGGD